MCVCVCACVCACVCVSASASASIPAPISRSCVSTACLLHGCASLPWRHLRRLHLARLSWASVLTNCRPLRKQSGARISRLICSCAAEISKLCGMPRILRRWHAQPSKAYYAVSVLVVDVVAMQFLYWRWTWLLCSSYVWWTWLLCSSCIGGGRGCYAVPAQHAYAICSHWLSCT